MMRPDSLETTAPYKFFTYLLTYLRVNSYQWSLATCSTI